MANEAITKREMKALLKSQQGELNAVLMYNALARTAKDATDAQTFRRLAAEEGRHAAVFGALTRQTLTPTASGLKLNRNPTAPSKRLSRAFSGERGNAGQMSARLPRQTALQIRRPTPL